MDGGGRRKRKSKNKQIGELFKILKDISCIYFFGFQRSLALNIIMLLIDNILPRLYRIARKKSLVRTFNLHSFPPAEPDRTNEVVSSILLSLYTSHLHRVASVTVDIFEVLDTGCHLLYDIAIADCSSAAAWQRGNRCRNRSREITRHTKS